MNAEALARARALDRMASAARRLPTPAMVAKAETIGRKAAMIRKGLPRSLPPGTVVMSASSFLSQAEFTRLVAGVR